MPSCFAVSFEDVTWATGSGDIDIFSLLAGSNKPIELVAVELSQTTEIGDAMEEQVRCSIMRGHTTVGSGGASATARPTSPGDSAFGGTARTNDTTIASAGTNVAMHNFAWNVRVGYAWGPVPAGMGIWTSGTEYLVVRLLAALTDDIDATGTAWFMEYP